jgi:hypothetical protein
MPFDKSKWEIIPGQQYLLDETVVTVIKALNRSKTTFSVETDSGIETVDKTRLVRLNQTQTKT